MKTVPWDLVMSEPLSRKKISRIQDFAGDNEDAMHILQGLGPQDAFDVANHLEKMGQSSEYLVNWVNKSSNTPKEIASIILDDARPC